jgi:hypothetical protein
MVTLLQRVRLADVERSLQLHVYLHGDRSAGESGLSLLDSLLGPRTGEGIVGPSPGVTAPGLSDRLYSSAISRPCSANWLM